MRGCLIIIAVLFIYALIFGENMGEALEYTLYIVLALALLLFVTAIIRAIIHSGDDKPKAGMNKDGAKADGTEKHDVSQSAFMLMGDGQDDDSHAAVVSNDETKRETVVVKLSLLQYQGLEAAVKRGLDFCKKMSLDDDLRKTFFQQAVNSGVYKEYSADDFFHTLRFFLANDLFDCFNHLGHKLEDIARTHSRVQIDYTDPAGQALLATLSLLTDKGADYQSFKEEILSVNQQGGTPFDAEIREATEKTLPVYLNSGASITAEGVDDFNMVLLLRSFNKEEYIPEIRKVYYDFAEAVALSDHDKDGTEAAWLGELKEKIVTKSVTQQPSQADDQGRTGTQRQDTQGQPVCDADVSPMKQLDGLIGLGQVKTELQTLTRFIEVNQKRQKAGLRVASISYHCVFAGNPGTGKTTVARILAGIYRQLGILKKGQLVETDRSGLVAEYVGQTAVKTNKIIDKALGGVLFIDEAYTLAQGGEQDYGREAIATLLKRMEDDRERLVVILAGYTQEIEQFISSNPGLRSRFNRYIHFEDYSEEELFQIFLLQAKKYDYKLNESAEEKLHLLLRQKIADKQKDFGNARYVRNLFEKVIENQAVRLAKAGDISKADLTVITQDDVFE